MAIPDLEEEGGVTSRRGSCIWIRFYGTNKLFLEPETRNRIAYFRRFSEVPQGKYSLRNENGKLFDQESEIVDHEESQLRKLSASYQKWMSFERPISSSRRSCSAPARTKGQSTFRRSQSYFSESDLDSDVSS